MINGKLYRNLIFDRRTGASLDGLWRQEVMPSAILQLPYFLFDNRAKTQILPADLGLTQYKVPKGPEAVEQCQCRQIVRTW